MSLRNSIFSGKTPLLQRMMQLFLVLFAVAQTISATHAGEDFLSEHAETCAFCVVSDRDDEALDLEKDKDDTDGSDVAFLKTIPDAMILANAVHSPAGPSVLDILPQTADLFDIAPRAPPVLKQTILFV